MEGEIILMRHSYRKLFTIPGAAAFCTAALIGRLTSGMIGLALILPLSQLTGSYTMAGAVTASTMLGMALAAPFSGRLVDRFGQNRMLLIFAFLNLIWTSILIFCAQNNSSVLTLCLVGSMTGASRLSTGTMARTRWAYVIQTLAPGPRSHALQSAYAFESIIDEVVFISAPILVTWLCTSIHPLAGLVCCGISFVIGAVALALQHRTQPMIEERSQKQSPAMSILGIRIIFAAVLCIGISAGALEVIVVARADALGGLSITGLLLATLSISSMISGFWYGGRSFKLTAPILWLRCMGLLFLALLPFALAPNLSILALALLIAGLAIAPTAISGQVLTERILPISILNEGMSLVVTAMILGMAFGSWLSGLMIDKLGMYLPAMLPAIAVLTALVIAKIFSHDIFKATKTADCSNLNGEV